MAIAYPTEDYNCYSDNDLEDDEDANSEERPKKMYTLRGLL